MPSINKAILLGHVGHTPKLVQSRAGTPATSISLATTKTVYNADGNRDQRTEWHKVVAFGRTAEILCTYVQKGNLLWVEGELQTRTYAGRDGQLKTVTEVVAGNVQFFRTEAAR